MKACTWCKEQFEVTDRDREFYKKMNVPDPTLCSDCRQQRRLMFRNERTLYSRACDLCKKHVVSVYPAETPFLVYCPACLWSDSKELSLLVPRISILSITSVNSDYTNNAADNKNCYLIFAAENNEDCYYGRLVQTCKDVVDCDCIYDSRRCYGSLDCRNCYNTHFSEKLQGCNDVLFGFNLSGCSSCILCTNLRNKEYHIKNKPVSNEEYEHKRAEILSSRESIDAARTRFQDLPAREHLRHRTRPIEKRASIVNNVISQRSSRAMTSDQEKEFEEIKKSIAGQLPFLARYFDYAESLEGHSRILFANMRVICLITTRRLCRVSPMLRSARWCSSDSRVSKGVGIGKKEREAIVAALEEQRILPSLFVIYGWMTFFCGVRPLLGFGSMNYISKMKEAWIDVLNGVDDGEHRRVESVDTSGLIGGLAVTYCYLL